MEKTSGLQNREYGGRQKSAIFLSRALGWPWRRYLSVNLVGGHNVVQDSFYRYMGTNGDSEKHLMGLVVNHFAGRDGDWPFC
jgi:hypothetical protein